MTARGNRSNAANLERRGMAYRRMHETTRICGQRPIGEGPSEVEQLLTNMEVTYEEVRIVVLDRFGSQHGRVGFLCMCDASDVRCVL